MQPTWAQGFCLALGTLLGNWLSGPPILGRTYTESFCVGLIAAGLVLLWWPLARYICRPSRI